MITLIVKYFCPKVLLPINLQNQLEQAPVVFLSPVFLQVWFSMTDSMTGVLFANYSCSLFFLLNM